MTGTEIVVALMLVLGSIGNAADSRGTGYAMACEAAGGTYYADEELLESTDLQLWRCVL